MKHSYRVPRIAAIFATLLISLTSGRGQALVKDDPNYSTDENEALNVAAPGVLRNELTLALSNPMAVGQDRLPVTTYGRTLIGNTLTDGFVYDPLNPTATLPALNYSAKNSFVANEPAGETIIISYDIAGTTLTAGRVIVFDLYGSKPTAPPDRDDDFDVEFLSDGVIVGNTVAGVIIQAAQYPPSPEHVRVSTIEASVDVGTTVDQIRIVARDSNGLGDPNYFTLQEVRAAFLKTVSPAVISHDATSKNGAEVVVNADGSFSFDPTSAIALQALNIGESLDDTFTYVVAGKAPLADRTATVTVTVNGRGRSNTFRTNEDAALSGVLQNFRELTLTDSTAVRLSDGLPVATVINNESSIGNTLTDGFAYDPSDPTVSLPELDYSKSNSFHTEETAGETVIITYDIAAEVMLAEGGKLVFDLYGRIDYARGVNRDNDFDVEFLSGGKSQGIATGLAIPDGAPQHLRVSTTDVELAVGKTIDQIRIIARNSSRERKNYFTLQEVRAAVLGPVTDVIDYDALSAKGAVVKVNADGSFDYDPTDSATLRNVGEGGSIVDTFTYVIGGTAPLVDRKATVTIIVNGARSR
ncbi:MAG: VCBS domain-containing protein [Verrucomicrobiota bacterium]